MKTVTVTNWQELIAVLADTYHDGKTARVAYAIGMSQSAGDKWKRGGGASLEAVVAMAEVYRLDPKDLMRVAAGKPVTFKLQPMVPIAGGSHEDNHDGGDTTLVVVRLIRSWLRRLLCPVVNTAPCFA